jgi:hypothetical protein
VAGGLGPAHGASASTPRGSKGGLEVTRTCGEQLTRDASTNEFYSYVTEYVLEVALRPLSSATRATIVRLANIDTSAIAETGSLLIQDMVKAYHQIPARIRTSGPRWPSTANPKVATYLHLQALDSTKNSTLADRQHRRRRRSPPSSASPSGMTDALTNTEADRHLSELRSPNPSRTRFTGELPCFSTCRTLLSDSPDDLAQVASHLSSATNTIDLGAGGTVPAGLPGPRDAATEISERWPNRPSPAPSRWTPGGHCPAGAGDWSDFHLIMSANADLSSPTILHDHRA